MKETWRGRGGAIVIFDPDTYGGPVRTRGLGEDPNGYGWRCSPCWRFAGWRRWWPVSSAWIALQTASRMCGRAPEAMQWRRVGDEPACFGGDIATEEDFFRAVGRACVEWRTWAGRPKREIEEGRYRGAHLRVFGELPFYTLWHLVRMSETPNT